MKTSNDLNRLFSQFLSPSEITAADHLAHISAMIEMWRVDHGMTQKEFAEKMGVSQAMVSKWESGDYNFTIKTLAEISTNLQISMERLFSNTYVEQQFSVPFTSSKVTSLAVKNTTVGGSIPMNSKTVVASPFEFQIVAGGAA